jgi:DNA-binding transcriptional LysR family regulator
MGLSFAPASAHARCPEQVALIPVPDLGLRVRLELVWRERDRDDPVLARFAAAAAEMTAQARRAPPRG